MTQTPPPPSGLLETYLAERTALRRLLRARLGNDAEAEDLVQEMFLRIKRGGLPAVIENPAGYLFRMALNMALDHRRGRDRATRRDGAWAGLYRSRLGDEELDEQPAADVALDARERLARVMTALEDLSPHARRVFTLHKFEGLSHAEIAASLGVTRGTVEKHMTTALKLLTARMREWL